MNPTWKKPKPRVRSLPGVMNKTEAAYNDFLRSLKMSNNTDFFGSQIIDFGFEKLKFKLAPKTFFTPDFFVVTEKEFQLHEVKGFWEDDARVKIKVFAEMFPWFSVYAIQRKNKEWLIEKF